MSDSHARRVGSWQELQDWLYENSWQEGLGRFRPNYAFRGLSAASHALDTGLAQLGDTGREPERTRNWRSRSDIFSFSL